jgi:hypothetical protein
VLTTHALYDAITANWYYIETAFNIQRRMADRHFTKAMTWEELRRSHERWLADYNFQEHWAHLQRPDNRRSPAEVLGWVTGTLRDFEDLQRIFYATRFGRRVDAHGSVRFRHWRLYAERGVGHKPVAVWLNQDSLTLEFSGETLAHYAVDCDPDRSHLKTVADPQFFSTRLRSPQPELWDLSAEDWRPIRRLPDYVRHRRGEPGAAQAVLFRDDLDGAQRDA